MSTPVLDHPQLSDLLRHHLSQDAASWSVSTFGAVAEFLRLPAEPVQFDPGGLAAVTEAGGIRFEALTVPVQPVSFQRPVGAKAWTSALALCLRAEDAAGPARTVMTELGPDVTSLRAADRDAVLFDLGLGVAHLQACVRTADPECLAVLRAAQGRSLSETPALVAQLQRLSPHRVFSTRLARVEVYGPIPPAHGVSPDAPHTHLLPKLLARGRTHAATEPIPDGWVPGAHLYPAQAVRDVLGRPVPFVVAHDAAAQDLQKLYGRPDANRRAQQVIAAVRAGLTPSTLPPASSGPERAAERVALRRLRHLDGSSPVLEQWCSARDPMVPTAGNGPNLPPSHPADS